MNQEIFTVSKSQPVGYLLLYMSYISMTFVGQ